MKAKRSIYKLSQSQATEIMNIGNQTGFHQVVVDYGYGLCIDVLPDDNGYDPIRNYIAQQGLQQEEVIVDLDPSGNPITYIVDRYYETIAKAKEDVISNTRNELIYNEALTQDEIDAVKPLYPDYEVGMKVYGVETAEHPITIFTYADKLWKVIQDHTTQADWLPDKTPALYKEIAPPGVIPVWKQPTGAHDAYQKGDKVYFPTINDQVYESLIDANVWSPTVYGWVKI